MLSETLSTLKMPLGPRVEFVLLCLQRHLGIVYGVVSLDSLDFVGGGAVDNLKDLVSEAGTTKDKLRFFHDWSVARLSPVSDFTQQVFMKIHEALANIVLSFIVNKRRRQSVSWQNGLGKLRSVIAQQCDCRAIA